MTGPTASELFDCRRVNDYLESYLLGQVPPPERRGMRLHIHRCADCFAKVTARDPLQLLAPLADEERPLAAWAGFEEPILASIRRQEAESTHSGRFPFPWRGRTTAARTAAAIVALAALVTGLLVLPRLMGRLRPAGALEVAEATPAFEPSAPAGDPRPQTVELVRTADMRPVQIYSMDLAAHTGSDAASDAAPAVAELVLIVDAGIRAELSP